MLISFFASFAAASNLPIDAVVSIKGGIIESNSWITIGTGTYVCMEAGCGILTAAHVGVAIQLAPDIEICSAETDNCTSITSSYITIDKNEDGLPDADWALFPLSEKPRWLGRAKFSTAVRGEVVTAVGYPWSGFWMSSGLVVGVADAINNATQLGPKILLVDANIAPGSSGGPLFDRHGKIVGIVAAHAIEPGPNSEDMQIYWQCMAVPTEVITNDYR